MITNARFIYIFIKRVIIARFLDFIGIVDVIFRAV